MAHADGRRSSLPLFLLLLLVIGGGAFNYHRNWQAEQEMPRPYRSYSDADLRALIHAYEEARPGATPTPSGASAPGPAGGGALLGERIDAFERARAASDARRRELERLGQHEAVLRELRKEETLRAELGQGLALHLRRLATL
jgi:hypothetical protein